jgi:hypothetical protein
MKQFFITLFMILAIPLAVCAQNFEFQYQGKPLENGAVSIEAAEDLFGDLSCETNPAEAPETGLMLVSKDGSTISGTAHLAILEHTFRAKSLQWCMGGACSPMNSVTELDKTFSGSKIQTQFDAYTIRKEGHLLAKLDVNVGGEELSIYIEFLNGEPSSIENITNASSRADVYDLSGRPVMLNADAIERQQLKRGVYIVKDSKSARKIIVK